MEITININAPELVQALQTLAVAIGNTKLGMVNDQHSMITNAPVTNIPVTSNTPVIDTPVQQVPQHVIPVHTIPTQTQAQTPVQQTASAQQTVPTQIQAYTMDQLAIAATQLMDAGKRNELLNLLAQFGVQALTVLPKEHYGSFATALRSMGAKI